jgi:hypothetical protein
MLEAIATIKQGKSNFLMCFLVVKVKHMLGVCLAGCWIEVGEGEMGSVPLVKDIYYLRNYK